jgi:DNA polymerase III subunit alpha
MSRLPAAMQLGGQSSKAVEAGQNDLFGLAAPQPLGRAAPAARAGAPDADPRASAAAHPDITALPDGAALPDWSEQVRLAGERETLGLYLTGHPIDRLEADLPRFVSARIADLVSEKPPAAGEGGRGFAAGRPASVAGLVDEVRKRGTRVSMVLDDRSGRLEVTLFDEVYQQHRDLIAKDTLVLVEGSLRFDEFGDSWRLAARRVTDLYKAREQQARRLLLRWPDEGSPAAIVQRLADVLEPWRKGHCPVGIQYCARGARCVLSLGSEWSVRPSRELLDRLEGLVGRGGVKLLYGPPVSVASFGAGGG